MNATPRTRLRVEPLEDRSVPSINIAEAEPNNAPATANGVPRVLGAEVSITGAINALGDRDWFKIDLRPGDVFGGVLKGMGGLDPTLRVVNAAGELVIANDDAFYYGSRFLPHESPLPRGRSSVRDAEVYWVAATAGTYYFEAAASGDGSAGKYNLDLVVARPGLESRPVGTRQTLFIDFNGADVRYNTDPWFGNRNYAISPLAQSLPAWGLTAADESAVVSAVLTRLTDKLSTFVRANGLNGDYAATGTPGQFDIDIRNSRDHADVYGTSPFVSRLVIGGTTDPQLANEFIGLNENIDVGNYRTDDQAIVAVNFVPGLLSRFAVQPPATKIDMIAEYIAIIAAHEVAHQAGCSHTDVSPTDLFAGTPSVMDISFEQPLGPDLTFGTADDRSVQLRADLYGPNSQYAGLHDALNTFAFGLSTGTGPAAGRAYSPTRSSPQTKSQFAGATRWPGAPAAPDWSAAPMAGYNTEVRMPDSHERGMRDAPADRRHKGIDLVASGSRTGCELTGGCPLGREWTIGGVYVGDFDVPLSLPSAPADVFPPAAGSRKT